MHKKEGGMFIIKIGAPEGVPKDENKEYKKEKGEGKAFTKEEYVGYSPKVLVDKLEDIKESIANQNTKEALMKIDNCIVRLNGKERPLADMKDPFITSPFQLDKMLPQPGKSS